MKALITGGGGQLASDLSALLGPSGHSFTHAELDIADTDAVERALAQIDPDVVLNCAAFHNVDVCEREPQRSWEVNVQAVAELGRRVPYLVHLSTNYVFDGRRDEPYDEFDLPSPRSVYALTKLSGEYAALAYAPRALVVRSAGLYGLHGSASKGGNFVQRMLARASQQSELAVVGDQRLSPTFTADLAAAIVEAIGRGADGILHLTASETCSWHEFTQAIMDIANVEIPVRETRTELTPGQPDRPLNGVLARPRADQLGLTPLRGWRDGLADYMSAAGLAADSTTGAAEAHATT